MEDLINGGALWSAQALGGGDLDTPWIAMCGRRFLAAHFWDSGTYATHNGTIILQMSIDRIHVVAHGTTISVTPGSEIAGVGDDWEVNTPYCRFIWDETAGAAGEKLNGMFHVPSEG